MNDKLDHFVLEYDHESGTALLAMTEAGGSRIAEGGSLPYAVAGGYEAESRTWESIEPFDDVARAKLCFEHTVQAREFYEQVFECAGDYDCTVNIWPAVDGGEVHVSVCPVAHGGNDLAVYSVDADKIGDNPITVRDLDDVGTREVYVEDFMERPDEVRFFLRTDADVYMFGSSLGKSLTVQYTGEEDIAPALREVRAYCKDAAEKRDPCLISAMAQASAAKSATAEGEAGGKKL